MDTHLDFSIFLLDGAAFGKASYDTSLARMPKRGDVLLLSELLPQMVKATIPSDELGFAEANIGKLSVIGVTTLASGSSGASLLVEIDDIVLDSREAADRLLTILEAVGFDCDVWTSDR